MTICYHLFRWSLREIPDNIEVPTGWYSIEKLGKLKNISTPGLGNCIGLTFYDPIKKVGGIAHIAAGNMDKLVADIIQDLQGEGANKNNLQIKIIGGDGSDSSLTVVRNIYKSLEKQNLPMPIETDLQESSGETSSVILDLKTGETYQYLDPSNIKDITARFSDPYGGTILPMQRWRIKQKHK